MQLLDWKPHYCLGWVSMVVAPACAAQGARVQEGEVDVAVGAFLVELN